MSKSWLSLFVAVAVVSGVTTGCSSQQHSAAVAPSSGGGSALHALVGSYGDYASCARAHGMPNLADPQVDANGDDHYPQLDQHPGWQWPNSVLTNCAAQWNQVRAMRARYTASLHSPQQQSLNLVQQRVMAACIRSHGFPSFPDPQPGGGFGSLPPGFDKANTSAAARTALNTCQQAAAGRS